MELLVNIFFLDKNPYTCAKWHGDKHVPKMLLEIAQMLSTAHHILGTDQDISKIYKATHINHPCNLWVRESSANYEWSWLLLDALCREFEIRRDKKHKTEIDLLYTLRMWPDIEYGEMTDPALAMPEVFKTNNAVESYRNYYKQKYSEGIVEYNWCEERKEPYWLF